MKLYTSLLILIFAGAAAAIVLAYRNRCVEWREIPGTCLHCVHMSSHGACYQYSPGPCRECSKRGYE